MTDYVPTTRLKAVIDDEGRKQRWLAQRAGIDESYLSRILNGAQCSASIRGRIASALKREVDEFWDEHGRTLWVEEVPAR